MISCHIVGPALAHMQLAMYNSFKNRHSILCTSVVAQGTTEGCSEETHKS